MQGGIPLPVCYGVFAHGVFAGLLRPLLSPANEGETGKQSIQAELQKAIGIECNASALAPSANTGAETTLAVQCPADIMQDCPRDHGKLATLAHGRVVKNLHDERSNVREQLAVVVNLRGGIPRARCGFVVVFHTGRKIKRGKGKRKEYFQLVFISIIRAFESGTHQGRIISIRNKPNRMNRHRSGKKILPRLPAAKSREGFQRGREFPRGQATRNAWGKARRGKVVCSPYDGRLIGAEDDSGFALNFPPRLRQNRAR